MSRMTSELGTRNHYNVTYHAALLFFVVQRLDGRATIWVVVRFKIANAIDKL